MHSPYGMSKQQKQCQQQVSQAFAQWLHAFLLPLLTILGGLLDKRLLRTCVGTVQAILVFRDAKRNLIMSEWAPLLPLPNMSLLAPSASVPRCALCAGVLNEVLMHQQQMCCMTVQSTPSCNTFIAQSS